MGFLKYIDRRFYWCQKIVKKWWLSQSYLELKKLKLRVEQSHVLLVITSKNQLILMFLEWNYGFLKVHSQGFVMIPKSGQEVMITMVKSHLKNRFTFARAPCNAWRTSFPPSLCESNYKVLFFNQDPQSNWPYYNVYSFFSKHIPIYFMINFNS